MIGIALGIWKAISGFFSAIFGFVLKYPLQCLAILGFVVALWYTNKWAVERTTTELNAKHATYIAKVEKQAADRETRIKELEESSKKAAAEAKDEIAAKNKAIEEASATYEQRLEDAIKNKKIEYVYIKVPGATKEVPIYIENGEVACRRLPSAFGDTVNEIVDRANGVRK